MKASEERWIDLKPPDQVQENNEQEVHIRNSRRSGGNMDWTSKHSTHVRSSHVSSVVTLPRKPRWPVLV